jgi:hypothetical protein
VQVCHLGFRGGAGEGNRTLMTSLEGWGSTIELRPRGDCASGSLPAREPDRAASTGHGIGFAC